MIRLVPEGPIEHVLCLGAHPDDIEIGALGLILHLAARSEDTLFSFVVLTGDDGRSLEAESSVRDLLGDRASLRLAHFTDGLLPYENPVQAKAFVRSAIEGLTPQLVIAPKETDRHQDHAFVADLAHQLLRDHLILEYEIAKSDADLGRPQIYLPLSGDDVDAKINHLNRNFDSQHENAWYDEAGFRALLRLRGVECSSPSGYAEAFHVSKLLLG